MQWNWKLTFDDTIKFLNLTNSKKTNSKTRKEKLDSSDFCFVSFWSRKKIIIVCEEKKAAKNGKE